MSFEILSKQTHTTLVNIRRFSESMLVFDMAHPHSKKVLVFPLFKSLTLSAMLLASTLLLYIDPFTIVKHFFVFFQHKLFCSLLAK